MSNYNFAAHAASDRRKWAAVTIAILFIIAVIVIGVLTDWFTNWNKYCLFGHDYGEDGICTRCGKEKLDEVEKASSDNNKTDEGGDDRKDAAVNGGGMASVLPGNGIRLMAAKMSPIDGVPTSVVENTWTLTATVNEEADNKLVDWTVVWVNPSSEWANGKTVTDYLTITPESDGALSATAKVLQAFGEQIKVVCTARDTTLGTKSAECLFDYVQKITGITFNMPQVSSETTSFSYEFETSDYTVASIQKLELSDGRLRLTRYFHNSLSIKLSALDESQPLIANPVIEIRNNNEIYLTASQMLSHGSIFGYGFSGLFCALESPKASASATKIYSCFCQAVQEVSGPHATFDVKLTATYSGQTYTSSTKTIDVTFDGDALFLPVSELTLDRDHILA